MKNTIQKIILLSLLLVLDIGITKAQYQSFFGGENTSWNGIPITTGSIVTDSFDFEKDTIINTVPYKKINRFMAAPSNQFVSSIFLREDTITGKLWHRCFQCNDTIERLLINMSLAIGDTFPSPLNPPFNSFYTVDSIYNINSKKHVRFSNYYINQYEKFTFIEGVGTTSGISYRLFPHILLCQHKDDSLNYLHNIPIYQNQCNTNLLDINEVIENEKFEVYPNPTDNILTIENILSSKALLKVISFEGKVVFSQILEGKKNTISLMSFLPGVYILLISEEMNSETYKKIIKIN